MFFSSSVYYYIFHLVIYHIFVAIVVVCVCITSYTLIKFIFHAGCMKGSQEGRNKKMRSKCEEKHTNSSG